MTRYFGKVCAKHPDLKGERMKSNTTCVGCKNEKRHRQAKAKYHNDPEYRVRYLANRAELKAKWNRYAQYTATRRAAVLQRTPAWVDRKKIAEIYKQAKDLGLTVDHIIPLQGELVSGLHVHNNLQLLSQSENDSKGNKYAPC